MAQRVDQEAFAELSPGPRARAVRRVTVVGLIANILLSAVKFAAGVFGHSQVLVADAVHTLADSTTDLTILIGVRYWSRPPDKSHPHGHGRIEAVITLAIAAALGGVAVGMTYSALAGLRGPQVPPPGWIAFAAAVLSIVVKEGLYRITVRVGQRVKSSAVIANAWHHRSDGLSSIPAAAAVALAAIVPAWSFVDPVAAVLVSLFVLHAAWKIGWPALEQLIDAGASEAERRRIERLAAETPGVREVHQVRTRYVGPGIQADLHVLVDAEATVRQGHDVATAVKRRLLDDGPDVLDVVVHVEPDDAEQRSPKRGLQS